MRFKILCVSSLCFFILLEYINSQQLDYNWLLGYPPNTAENYFGGVLLDFKGNSVAPTYFNTSAHLNQPAILSSPSGTLLCYSNGCKIYDSIHNVIPNGDSISYGGIWDNYCDNFYPGTQNRLLLPWPGDSLKAVLFHLLVSDNFETHYLLYSTIAFDTYNLNGVVTQKNSVLFDVGTSALITATKHANGRDWWIIVPEDNSNKYFSILFNSDGVSQVDSQYVGTAWGPREWASQAVFSPNGERYIRANPWKGIDILDFDRCTGKFTNIIESGPITEPVEVGCGAAVSIDSRYLYISNVNKLYQYDLMSKDIFATEKVVGTYDGFEDPFPTNFYQMALGPDGKIYVFSTNGIKSLHVIDRPTVLGMECNFIQHSIELPAHISIGALNMPYFRLGPIDGSNCDSLGINNFPKADFRYSIDSTNNRKVRFTNLSYYNPSSYNWEFGNNQSSTNKEPTFIYNSYGIYNVCLKAFNEYGSNEVCHEVILDPIITETFEQTNSDQFFIHQNPFISNCVVINNSEISNSIITIYSVFGEEIASFNLLTSNNVLDFSNLTQGVYLYMIKVGSEIIKYGKLCKVY